MLRFVTSYLLFEVLVVVLAVAATYWGRRRRLRKRDARSLVGFEETEETFVDPTTGIRQRVWFNPSTGERRYVTVEP
ncbi:MAG TPA: hypothetical protein VKA00_02715 [Trueperaceae bacterium]|nr:hypothetical protein [Trueperaceae bacterium]